MTTETEVTTIRHLDPEEVYLCVDSGREFYREAGLPGKFLPEIFTGSWERLIKLRLGTIIGAFVDGNLVGAIGGIAYPDINDGELVVTEAFWYMDAKHRQAGLGAKLYHAFEVWVQWRGARRIIMVALPSSGEMVIDWYKKQGYRLLETQFIKEV